VFLQVLFVPILEVCLWYVDGTLVVYYAELCCDRFSLIELKLGDLAPKGVQEVLEACYKVVTRMLQECYKGVTKVEPLGCGGLCPRCVACFVSLWLAVVKDQWCHEG
jgi:hypothetical protein